jgi:hypothetical protein
MFVQKSRTYFPYFYVRINGNYFLLLSKSGVQESTKAHPSLPNPSNFPLSISASARTKHVRGQKVVILLKKRQYWLCSPEIPGPESISAGKRESRRAPD